MNTLDACALADAANDLIDARLRAGGAIHFTVPTWSMAPTLTPGDRVIVQAARADELRVGDIVLVKAGAVWLAHRLIGRQSIDGARLLVTKGDNCATPDEAWQAARLGGVVTAVQRDGREIGLTSRRARWSGAMLARLSCAQASLQRIPFAWARRIALKASRILLRLSASLARWVARQC